MGRGLAAAALLAVLIMPTAAQAKPSLLPWPNDALTKRDKTTDTGRRLNLPRAAMPRNKDGVPIDPTDMNRADGFSPGSMIIVKVPGLDNPAALARATCRGSPTCAQPAQALARRRLQRPHGPAPPGLGRARLERDHGRCPHAADPARQELHGGRALRRRAAQPQGRQRGGDHAQAPTALGRGLRAALRRAGIRRRHGASTAPGRSRSRASAASPAACSTSATTPSPRSATATCAT